MPGWFRCVTLGHVRVGLDLLWHGFVMCAAAGCRDRLPFDAQEVHRVRLAAAAAITQRDCLDFLPVCVRAPFTALLPLSRFHAS